MRLREQPDIHEPGSAPVESSVEIGDDTEPLRDEGAALLSAADAAINRALSRDSNEFLAQNRQQGGQ